MNFNYESIELFLVYLSYKLLINYLLIFNGRKKLMKDTLLYLHFLLVLIIFALFFDTNYDDVLKKYLFVFFMFILCCIQTFLLYLIVKDRIFVIIVNLYILIYSMCLDKGIFNFLVFLQAYTMYMLVIVTFVAVFVYILQVEYKKLFFKLLSITIFFGYYFYLFGNITLFLVSVAVNLNLIS